MVSGPISTHKNLGPQLFEEHRFEYNRVVSGLRRAAWELSKKVVVADRLVVLGSYCVGAGLEAVIWVPTGVYRPLMNLFMGAWDSFGGMTALVTVVIVGLLQIVCDIRTYGGKSSQDYVGKLPFALRWASYISLVFLIIFSGNFG